MDFKMALCPMEMRLMVRKVRDLEMQTEMEITLIQLRRSCGNELSEGLQLYHEESDCLVSIATIAFFYNLLSITFILR